MFLDDLSIRSKAINLVDSVLEQSINYVSQHHDLQSAHDTNMLVDTKLSDQVGPSTPATAGQYNVLSLDGEPQDQLFLVNVDNLHSESENFAITCDLSNEVEFMKSPTIESISGRSFDDNMSGNENEFIEEQFNANSAFHVSEESRSIATKNVDKIDRRFDRLSSQLDELDLNDDSQNEFEKTVNEIDHVEVNRLQNEFSHMSWDESLSTTTADQNLSTPDNDLHDLNQGD